MNHMDFTERDFLGESGFLYTLELLCLLVAFHR